MSATRPPGRTGRAISSAHVLVTVTVLVSLALLAGSVVLARSSFDRAADERRTADIAQISDVSLDLLLALQAERSLMAGREAETANTELRALLDDAREETDLRLDHTIGTWREVRSNLPDGVRSNLDEALALEGRISEMRAVAAPGDAEPTEVLDVYAEPILDLVGALSLLTTVVDDADDVRTRAGLVALFDAIEATGDERALLLSVFAMDRPLNEDEQRALLETRGAQRADLDRYEQFVDEQNGGADVPPLAEDPLAETARIVDRAVERADVGDYDVDPEDWYRTATETMDALAVEAETLNEQLLTEAEADESEAETEARLLLVGGAGTGVLAMALGITTAISTRRRRAAEREIRTIADTLQRSLLPTSFPDRPEIELVGRYEARAEHAIVGGDWYDVLELTPDCIGLVIGDVSGHSIEAMATMARLRYSFGAEAYDRTEPAVVMQRMHELLDDAGPSGFTTVFYAVLDLVDGNLTYTSAGHPPPVVLEPDGSTRLLDGRPGVLLGTDFETRYETRRSTLEPGSTLALYTDGLVERRREPIDVGIDRLRQSLTRGPREPLEQLADAVFGDLVGRWTRDDVALLIVRWVEPATDDESSDAEVLVSEKPGRNGSSTTDEPGEGGGPPVEVDADAETQDAGSMETNEVKATFPADLSAAHSGRRLVASTLDRWQLPQLIDDAELLSSELVSNAVSHGDGGGVDVRVVRESSRVRIEVTDDGDGHPHVRSASSPRPGGYGLVVVDRVAADWGVLPTGARGKTVWATLEAS